MTSRRIISYAAGLLFLFEGPALAQVPAIDTAAAIRSAEAVAHQWLAAIDEGRVVESWEDAATLFKLAVTKSAWDQAVRQARGPFEPFGVRERIMAEFRTQLPNAPPGQYVLLQYRTVVAGDSHVIETVVPMLDADRGWRVSGYFVRPD